ncbi:uncharacterized protein I303_107394 [Kwoniella dejecticola CBS 10117]|uniref:WD40 repeat-like protein n=1 Tax=Kwoniella dejecticola CBS 10117 TaxID=1296121 RepID=A0A1A5ZZK7_9TREE|nr:uncharacterized protein I303_06798 [Kwoniella dejecticola CBS 10117]OBR83237.1 hypothetical protein I303_06798 [Kwoniella dejecticola CBS 10117]
MTLLLTHPTSISLLNLPKPFPSSIQPNSLALPSRFPSSATPQVVASANGHIYLYSSSRSSASHVIWEYDGKGRRISEISLPGETINKVLPINMPHSHSQRVIVSLEGTKELRIYEKEKSEGKWRCMDTLQGPDSRVTALVGNIDSSLIVAGSDSGELVVYDLVNGDRTVVSLGGGHEEPISPLLTFCPSLPSTLLLPTPSALLRLTIPSPPSASSVDMCEIPIKGSVLDITFSPMVESADGSKKGGLCAVLKERGEVALIGIDSESSPKVISFGQNLEGITFLDGATLAGRTEEGSLLVKDLRSLSKGPVPISCDQPITSIRLLSSSTRSRPRPRPSLAPSAASSTSTSRRLPLSEKQSENVPTVPSVPDPQVTLKTDHKRKAVIEEKTDLHQTKAPIRAKPRPSARVEETIDRSEIAPGTGTASIPAASSTSGKEAFETRHKDRRVSAPILVPQERITQPRASGSSSRSASGPAPPKNDFKSRLEAISTASKTKPPHASSREGMDDRPLDAPSKAVSSGRDGTKSTTNVHELQRSHTPHTHFVETLEEVPEEKDDVVVEHEAEDEGRDRGETDIQLGWALKSPLRIHGGDGDQIRGGLDKNDKRLSEAEMIEELRRELGNMHLNMLRMGRNLKKEIRNAVGPLEKELKQNREVIETQRREIERLRRGY